MLVSIFVYPRIKSKSDLDSLVSRFAWYFSPLIDQIKSIELSCEEHNWLREISLSPNLDRRIENLLPKITAKIVYRSEADVVAGIEKADPARDIVLIADETAEESMPPRLKIALEPFIARGGRYRVDSLRTRQEGSFYLWAGLNKLTDTAALKREHESRFATMAAEIGDHQRAYVFGTGPSFSDFVQQHNFDDGICIVANSIVKDESALEILNPHIICAGDPIYHAGCSSYAAEFRKSLVKALEKTGAWFVCPMRDANIYRAILPPHLERRMVCIPFDAKKPIPTDIRTDFYINPFPNILTLALLPLASTFAECIHIVGCDGRRLLDDSFFWSHDKKVQFNDQMCEIQEAHPGFFAIDYNDYFIDHCLDVERVLSQLEECGKTIISETPSLIPALAHRARRPHDTIASPELRAFVMIDPDAKDDWGHFLAYDKRLARAVRGKGLDFALLCRTELPQRFFPEEADSVHPVFNVNSWTIGNKSPPEREKVLSFCRELEQGLSEIESRYLEGNIVIFFYVGSLEAAEILEFLLLDHPRVYGVINLFWSYNFDQNEPEYVKRWQAIVRRIDKHPRLRLMHSTAQIAEEFSRDWGVSLPVLEHPSTTFSDQEARQLVSGAINDRPDRSKPLHVVFPGGARAEKGFVLSCQTIRILREDPNLSLTLRSRLDQVSGAALYQAFAKLDTTGVEVLDQDLSDAEFIEMIRSADIVVIPYTVEAFRRRTSGIMVDAMLLGKPVVVIEGTWLGDIVAVEGTGVCAASTPDAIAEAVRSIVQNYGTFASAIEVARRAYMQHNTWDSLVHHVCSLTGDHRFDSNSVHQSLNSPSTEGLAYILLNQAYSKLAGDRGPQRKLSDAQVTEIILKLGAIHPVVHHYLEVDEFVQRRGFIGN